MNDEGVCRTAPATPSLLNIKGGFYKGDSGGFGWKCI